MFVFKKPLFFGHLKPCYKSPLSPGCSGMFGHALAPRKTLVIINRSTDTKSKCLSTMTKWQSSFSYTVTAD